MVGFDMRFSLAYRRLFEPAFFFVGLDFFVTRFFSMRFLTAPRLAGFDLAGLFATAGFAECTAKKAPCRSTPCAIQSPPGTWVGPCISPPNFLIFAAAFFASGTLM